MECVFWEVRISRTGCREGKEGRGKDDSRREGQVGSGEKILISTLDTLSLKFYGDSRPRAPADSRIYRF